MCIKDLIDCLIVLLGTASTVRITGNSALTKGFRHVVLCGKRVTSGDVHFRSSCGKCSYQTCGLCLYMESHADAVSSKRLFLFKAFTNGVKNRHILLCPLYFLFAGMRHIQKCWLCKPIIRNDNFSCPLTILAWDLHGGLFPVLISKTAEL